MYEYIVLNVNIFVILRYFSQYCVVDLIKSIKSIFLFIWDNGE